MAALYVLAARYWPIVVRHLDHTLLGKSLIATDYFSYGWWALLFAWGSLEVGGLVLILGYRAKPHEYPAFRARLERLAEEAGVRTPTLIVLKERPGRRPGRERLRGMGRVLNAAATQSVLTGPKLVLVNDIVETLTDSEAAYVTAHELSHIRHIDIIPGVLIGAGNTAIAVQKWSILALGAIDLLAYGWHALVYLASTWVVLSLTHAGYKLIAAAHSRAREYLADVGAVRIAGWDQRAALIVGLAAIHHAAGRWRPFRIFQPKGTVLSTHPTIFARARALKLNPRVRPDGNVDLDGGTTIAG